MSRTVVPCRRHPMGKVANRPAAAGSGQTLRCRVLLIPRLIPLLLLLLLVTGIVSFHSTGIAIQEHRAAGIARAGAGSGGEEEEDRNNPLNLHSSISIFVYDLPPFFNRNWLQDDRCRTHLFAAEVALHGILEGSPVRTLDPRRADFFFLPVYVSCNFSTRSGFPSLGRAAQQLRAAVNLVSHRHPYWERRGGRDHIFVATHDFGACFHASEAAAVESGIPQFLSNSIILQTFGQQGPHPCQDPSRSIQIPPYVHLDPRTQQVPHPSPSRDIWAFFRGKMELHPRSTTEGGIYSRGVRTTLWQKFGHDSRFFIKRKRSDDYQLEMLRSIFCLCPLGWAPWSPRIVEAVIFGCVPVIIADDIALPFSQVIDWPRISLRIPEKDVHLLDKVLEKVTSTNLSAIQRELWKPSNRRALLYNNPSIIGDAAWQILDHLSRLKASQS